MPSDEFDESKLPFTQTAIFAALVNAAEENKPVPDLATVGDIGDILHRMRLRLRHAAAERGRLLRGRLRGLHRPPEASGDASPLDADDESSGAPLRRGAATAQDQSRTASARSRCSSSCSAPLCVRRSAGAACASLSSSFVRSPPSERTSTPSTRPPDQTGRPRHAFPADPRLDPGGAGRGCDHGGLFEPVVEVLSWAHTRGPLLRRCASAKNIKAMAAAVPHATSKAASTTLIATPTTFPRWA